MNKSAVFVFAIILGISGIGKAQEWNQTNGPSGNTIKSISLDKNGDILVLSSTLHISTDSGASWKQIGEQFSFIKFVIPSPWGDLFIIGGDPFGVWKSRDNGLTWSLVLPGSQQLSLITASDSVVVVVSNFTTRPLSFRSTNGGLNWDSTAIISPSQWTVYSSGVDIHGTLFNCTNNGVYRSTDFGISWAKILNGLPDGDFTTISCAPNGNDYLGGQQGIYRSADSGRTWEYLPTYQAPYTIVISTAGRILSVGNKITYSDDFGQTWISYGEIFDEFGYPTPPSGVAAPDWRYGFFVAAKGCLLHADLQSADPWKVISVPMSSVTGISACPDGSILATTNSNQYKALWRSIDQGKSWGLVFDSVQNLGFRPTCFAIDSDKNVLLGSAGVIYRSTNAGLNWKPLSVKLTDGILTSLTVTPKGNIFATSSLDGIYRSSDNGSTWDQLNSGLTDGVISSVVSTASGELYAAGWNLYRSTNDGLSWTSLPGYTIKSYINSIRVTTTGNIIAAVNYSGLIESTDKGITWFSLNNGLTTKIVNSILFAYNGVVFAGTDSGVFKLDIGSSIWQPYSLGLSTKYILSLTQSPTGQIYAGSDGSGVFRSTEAFGSIGISSVEKMSPNTHITISAPHPNPSSKDCAYGFTVSKNLHLRIELIDALGRVLQVLSEKEYAPGEYHATLDLSKYSSGYYVLRFTGDAGSQSFPVIRE